MATRYIVKLSGGCSAGGRCVDGEYGSDPRDESSLVLAREEARWFAECVVGGSIRIVTPVESGERVETVEVVR